MEKGNEYLTRLFKQLSSKDQTEVVDKLFNDIIRHRSSGDSVKLIIEKLPGECEEGLRLRRFQKILMEHFYDASYLFQLEVEERLKKGTILYIPEEKEGNSNYAEFLLGVSIIWFKSRCASHQRRNPIQLILFGEVEFSDIIEKLPEESNEDFRLRRFTESFKQLPLALQERIFDFIEPSVVPYGMRLCSGFLPFEGSRAFDSGFFKVKHPNLKDQGAAVTQGAGGAAVGGQWISNRRLRAVER